jgi:outer membrane protein
MNHKIAVYLILAILQGAGLRAQQAGTRVAVVDGQRALLETREGKKAFEQLRARFEARKKEFDSRQNEIDQLVDQLNKSGSLMNDDKRAQLADSTAEKKKRLQRDQQDATDEAQKDQQQIFQPISGRLDSMINKYAVDNAYSVVLDYSVPGNPVRYAAMGVDITKEVVALYDKTYGEGAPPGKP